MVNLEECDYINFNACCRGLEVGMKNKEKNTERSATGRNTKKTGAGKRGTNGKSAVVKTTLREIKGSLGRYIAILAIVALGIGLFAGLKVTKPAMIKTQNRYLKEKNFFDFNLISTLGFTDEDAQKIAKADDEVEDVEATVSIDAMCAVGSQNETVFKIHALPDRINKLELVEGRMPENNDECVLDAALYKNSEIGSNMTITGNNTDDTLAKFKTKSYKVVGIVNSPCYINFERGTTSIGQGKVAGFAYVPESSMDFQYKTQIYVTLKNKYDVYSDKYKDYIDSVQNNIEEATKSVVDEHYNSIINDAQDKINAITAMVQGMPADNPAVQSANAQIEQIRNTISQISGDYYVLTRNSNIGYACYESDSNIVAAVSNVFPVFFFLVAALVCMTTMNRMVEEQRTQIGVLKALGYGNKTIMGKYIFYSGSAAFIGTLIGFSVGTWIFPKTIWKGYSIMYNMGSIDYLFSPLLAAISLVAALVCSVGATWVSCKSELSGVPASLIRPKPPKNGKRIFLERITFIWKRMKFLHKVSIRNVLRYKKRFFMMIIGISGCTALLVAGFGIKDSVANIADLQYDDIQVYDFGITFADPLTDEFMNQFSEYTKDYVKNIAYRDEESVDIDYDGKTKSVYMEVPQDTQSIESFFKLHTKSGEKIEYPSDGEAVITAKVADTLGIKAGDKITIRDSEMNQLEVTVKALCENYVYNYIYINKDTYFNQLGRYPEYKGAFAFARDGMDLHEASAHISEGQDVISVTVIQDLRQRIGKMMSSMDYIVFMIIVCAGCLAFIVLYNLTNINITERIREIATIKVLGFYPRETADYVFRENIVLTAIGAGIGLIMGKLLHQFIMYNINIDMVSFKTYVSAKSYLLSFIFTFVFAMLVNILMYRKLQKINMAESLKSIE